jgi:hypothetical protein
MVFRPPATTMEGAMNVDLRPSTRRMIEESPAANEACVPGRRGATARRATAAGRLRPRRLAAQALTNVEASRAKTREAWAQ